MSEPVWLSIEDIEEFARKVGASSPGHFVQLIPAKLDALQGAIERPLNKHYYGREDDPAVLAAEYVFGIGKAHAFSDGNKRIAFLSAKGFLELNYLRLVEPAPGFFAAPVWDLMANKIDVPTLADLIADHIEWAEEGAE